MNASRRARKKANKALVIYDEGVPDETDAEPAVPAVTVQAGLASASGSVNDDEERG